MPKEKFPDNSDDSFWREHSTELVVGSAIGLLGLAFAVAARRMNRALDGIEHDQPDAPNCDGPSDNS